MAIKHAFTSAKEDGADATLVRPSDWNAEHTGIKIVRKTADETVNNSAVLQNDDHLFFSVGANEVWILYGTLRASVLAANDIKIAFTMPTGGEAVYYSLSSGGIWVVSPNAHETLIPGDRTDMTLYLGGIVYNGATAGNIQMQWAQVTASVADTILKINSTLIAFRVV